MKLVVEVVDAHDLMPKDGEGSASSFVEVDFENQISRTKTIPKNLNPIWNQKLQFNLDETKNYHHQTIEISVYNERKPIPGRNFLGRVRFPCLNIVKQGEEAYQKFQLERKWFFSSVKGEIGLKIYILPDSVPKSSPSSSPPQPPEAPSSSPQPSEFPCSGPSPCANTSPISENKNITSKLLATIPKEEALVVETPKTTIATAEPVKEVHAVAVLNSTSSPLTEAEPTGAYLDKDTEELKEPIQERAGSVQHVLKHQSVQQHSVSVKERAQGGPFTMHQVNPQGHTSHHEDYDVKDTNPQLGERWPNGPGYGGRGWMSSERFTSTNDLVEQTFHLYVRVVKAKDLPPSSITGSCDPYVEVKLGNYKGRTKHFEKKMNPEWNQVFAFSKDRIQSSVLEVFVKDKEMVGRDDYFGRVVFDLNEIPTRVPPDSPLAPQWYRLEDRRAQGKVKGEIMLAVWMGTQADEAFPEAWHSDAASVFGEGVYNIRSKVYVSPKLWYLRVNVIEAQDVLPNDRNRLPEVFVKAQVGNQVLKTTICPTPTTNPHWNEDLVFVAAEPFEEQIFITVEDRLHPSKDEMLGKISLPLDTFERRLDHRPVHSRWFNLEKYGFGILEADRRKELKFSSRIHLRVCLEGGYHVLDESTMYISDQRPTARQLWKQPVGILEVGILSAEGLLPMKMKDGRGSTDAFCVAKYGQKWVRTRTILDTLNPKWNEQYTWEVYDPCTVITLGVFDNCHLGGGERPNGGSAARDSRIGKVRIRLSTLEAHRVYTHSYPLLVLQPHGVKKMGELQLAVRFTILSLANMVYVYGHPSLPKMHYLHPFTVNQVENLRYQAMNIVAVRLGRAEPPLRKEVVEYMLDVDSHVWSMRRSKANFFRVISLLSGMFSASRWFADVCNWKNPITSVLVHILFLILIWYPELILPTLFLYMFLIGLWNYRFRPRHPPHMDTKLSWAETVNPDELDEEFDTFPTSRPHDIVRMRYDRLRSVAGRIQTVVGDIATQGERLQALLSWRDTRATSLFILFCLCAAVVLYVTPFRVVALLAGLYYLRHPRFRSKLPSVPSNFFKRLPARTDSLL
ncbi:Multiple C2 and transmembrane domain-containing protein 2 [Morella rubra]|uniref:Multiple C2 and transmembrane domain-containing protein 2 n=1 Tax=Morella rubra TaxID=262757 RepID=A0A6A1WHU6_9ROSI|nr:Multiple C2 and transmembrane domain-containing protein 2 [Morella rubra]